MGRRKETIDGHIAVLQKPLNDLFPGQSATFIPDGIVVVAESWQEARRKTEELGHRRYTEIRLGK